MERRFSFPFILLALGVGQINCRSSTDKLERRHAGQPAQSGLCNLPQAQKEGGCVLIDKPAYQTNMHTSKCDEVKPTCGLCSRLGTECVGNGVKRWKFMPYRDDAGSSGNESLSMSRTPSNETTSLAAALVHALEVQDVRYNIRTFGGKLMSDLPSQLGTNPELDTTVAAVVALYTARQSHRPKVKALKRYGEALSAASRVLEKQNEPAIIRMQTVMMLFICQVGLRPCSSPCDTHLTSQRSSSIGDRLTSTGSWWCVFSETLSCKAQQPQ